jgi:hypothetical protein
MEGKGELNASQFGFRALHRKTVQWVKLTDHVTLNFNNKMATTAVFSDVEKASDIAWQPVLLYKLPKLEFSTSLIKLISSFLSQQKSSVSLEGEMSTPREIKAGFPQRSVLSHTLYNLCTNDTPQKICVNLSLSLLTTPASMWQNARRATISENSNPAWTQQWPDVNAGTLKSMKTRLGKSNSLIELGHLSLFLYWMDGTFHLWIV